MKKNEYLKELRIKTKTEMLDELTKQRKKLVDLRIEHSLGKLKDVKMLSKTKKQIAQILTVLTQIRE